MIVTEEEAKTKWCPMARVLRYQGSCNMFRDGGIPDGAFCIASGCMMWEMFDNDQKRGCCGLAR